ncbi:MAG TPA: DUF4433 domain-containing protein [Polyangiaceae bacterium]|nr:DUF4433 domain-containing protein [Polyangiaceae bacterium]
MDWQAIDGRKFSNADRDIKRRKQAEFMVHRALPWSLVRGIAVCDAAVQQRVDVLQGHFPEEARKPVRVIPKWYF